MKPQNDSIELRLLRHGDRYSLDHPDPLLRGQLTEEGQRDSWQYGRDYAQKNEGRLLRIKTSPKDRALHTGLFIRNGYDGLSLDEAISRYTSQKEIVPDGVNLITTDALKENDADATPESPVSLYLAGKMSRDECIKACYEILKHKGKINDKVYEEDYKILVEGVGTYMREVIGDLVDKKEYTNFILIGHDPNIGCSQQGLAPSERIAVVKPLEGIRFWREVKDGRMPILDYEFRNANKDIVRGQIRPKSPFGEIQDLLGVRVTAYEFSYSVTKRI